MTGGSYTPPPCMAGYSSFVPPYIVAEPNILVLKIFWKPGEIYVKFRLKNPTLTLSSLLTHQDKQTQSTKKLPTWEE